MDFCIRLKGLLARTEQEMAKIDETVGSAMDDMPDDPRFYAANSSTTGWLVYGWINSGPGASNRDAARRACPSCMGYANYPQCEEFSYQNQRPRRVASKLYSPAAAARRGNNLNHFEVVSTENGAN